MFRAHPHAHRTTPGAYPTQQSRHQRFPGSGNLLGTALAATSCLAVALAIGCHWPNNLTWEWWPWRARPASPGQSRPIRTDKPQGVPAPAGSVSDSAPREAHSVTATATIPRAPQDRSGNVPSPSVEPATYHNLAPPAAPSSRPEPVAQSTPPIAAFTDATVSAATTEIEKIDELYRAAAQRYAAVEDYVCRFRRREVLPQGKTSEDLILLRFRKQPHSIHFLWPKGTPEEGREVIYVQGRFNNQLVVRTGKGDLWSGLRVELAIDSPRATANTRRTFLEVGVGYLVESLGQVLREHRQGTYRFGRLRYLGPQARSESATPMECLLQEVPANLEKYLPRGGKRYFYLATDPRTQECHLPILVITHDDTGREVEYYCYDRFNINIGLRDEDFDPDRLWAKK